jgi:hypothetical protein
MIQDINNKIQMHSQRQNILSNKRVMYIIYFWQNPHLRLHNKFLVLKTQLYFMHGSERHHFGIFNVNGIIL